MKNKRNKEHLINLEHEAQSRGLAVSTVKLYVAATKRFFQYYDGRPAEELKLQELKDYQRYLLVERKLVANSVNGNMGGIKFFYLHVLGIMEYGQLLPRVRVPLSMPNVLSEVEIGKMIEVVTSPMWKAVLLVMYSCGLREGEIRNLRVSHVDSSRMLLFIKNAKGAKDRQAILQPMVLKALRGYWQACRMGANRIESDYLFVPNKRIYMGQLKTKLSQAAPNYIVKRAAELAGVKKTSTPTSFVTPLQLTY